MTDALGVSGLAMIRALAAGETDANQMSELAHGNMASKMPMLRRALEGQLTDTQDRYKLAIHNFASSHSSNRTCGSSFAAVSQVMD